jgi:bacillithiol biosynthesis cysteine-adding enzyme BshC
MNRKKNISISYSEVGMLSQLTRDYLENKDEVKPFYGRESNSFNITHSLKTREKFPEHNRKVLVEVLKQQYGDLSTLPVKKNIEALLKKNTYTITTGHQLNLFTGPLYFIYKIVSAIQTAKQLSRDYPDKNFVPVYWMATEDHDFEEINHTYLGGEKIEWKSEQTGMVGDFDLNGMEEVVEKFCNALGDSLANKEVIKLIKKAYLDHSNLADATRFLVHSLFETHGLVILDGNSKELKTLFAPIVKDEIENKTSYKSVTKTIEEFGKYKAQVAPREINLFYVTHGIRERIVEVDSGYHINNTEIYFDKAEMLLEIENYPERFSPNVILRPVYQEIILPNLVYIGGGAEVAYWLELKSTFESFKVLFPLIQIRSSFLALSEKSLGRIEKLGLEIKDVYRSKEDLISVHVKSVNPFNEKMDDLLTRLKSELINFSNELTAFDTQLNQSIGVADKGIDKSISRLRKKVNSSVRRNNADYLNGLDQLFNAVYPNGVYQERQVNFFELYTLYGDIFVNSIFAQTEPFCTKLRILNL